ncbi:siderophore-interacting protein [Actinotalea sp. JY-7876]|uniref:siderophore-interacting protein n=1 Tax=Actinotalea sp. JY-7876 TaxID=2758442 RepID=UPI0015F4F848|nr:siderophore-interacting protein [Actinotalea sp. JY-7876]
MSASTLNRVEPAYRAFEVEVLRARRLSPSFLRMTFTGPDLDLFADDGLDQRIKLVLPAACGARVDAALFTSDSWFETWRAMPDDERYPLRTYTVRAVRQAEREVDVDVVLHGVAPGAVTTRGCGLAELLGCACSSQVGPAVRWCAAARSGDPIVLIGPNARFDGRTGIEWQPPADAGTFLLAGDETAVPAICSIVEQLSADARGHAFLEVPTAHDVLEVRAPAGVELHWLPRSRPATDSDVRIDAPHGSLLDAAVRSTVTAAVERRAAAAVPLEDVDVDHQIMWEVPEQPTAADGVYAWIAGEAGVVKELRRFLVRDIGLDRRSVAFMGYWRHGRAEG